MNLDPSVLSKATAHVDIAFQMTSSLKPKTVVNSRTSLSNLRWESNWSTSKPNILSTARIKKKLANGFQSWSQSKVKGAQDRIQENQLPGILNAISKGIMISLIIVGTHSFKKLYARAIRSPSLTHSLPKTWATLTSRLTLAPTLLESTRMCWEDDAEQYLWDTYASFLKIDDLFNLVKIIGAILMVGQLGITTIESIIMDNIQALKKHQYPINIFQIGDGFQTAIGSRSATSSSAA
ncbi:hypothetical protein BC941DRAFT_469471 [Chlamydoabsidia padenii]|nr:hypothetical protein BC941DRAFT_469471 [Chlamydoabsidia padenii]